MANSLANRFWIVPRLCQYSGGFYRDCLTAEVNPERKTLYQLCWHLGANQGDIANLKGEDVDWTNTTVSLAEVVVCYYFSPWHLERLV